jgi:hypothetical protein
MRMLMICHNVYDKDNVKYNTMIFYSWSASIARADPKMGTLYRTFFLFSLCILSASTRPQKFMTPIRKPKTLHLSGCCVIQDAWIKHPDLVSITTTTQIFLILIRKIYKRNGHFQSCLTAFIHLAWVVETDVGWSSENLGEAMIWWWTIYRM